MDARYRVEDTRDIISPALVIFRDLVIQNIQEMIRVAGSVGRLRPHCKTHKMRQVAELLLQHGIQKHKAATFAEAELLALAGAQDVFLAYNLVGPNIGRAVAFRQKFPAVQFAVTADHPRPLRELGEAMAAAGEQIDVLLDLDVGQHRTGVPVGAAARELYREIARTPGVRPGGFHVYDGHHHQRDLAERTQAVRAGFAPVAALREELARDGLPVPRIVAGGTGSFPVYAQMDDPAVELSPGTCIFHDAGYGEIFPDLSFAPAALLLTRVISRPTAERVTCDLGYKAVASDPPAGNRLRFPDLPDAKAVLQNEEHLVLETPEADRFAPGDLLWAIPRHVCPTSALHKLAFVVAGGQLVDRWEVAARDRWLSV